jgi:spectinomycin phosphotransferase
MRENPGLDAIGLAACLKAQYSLDVATIAFLPIGYDLNAAVYEVVASDGTAYFLKVRFGPVHEPGLLVPRALIDRGVPNVLAPLRTRSSNLWASLDGYDDYCVVLYPFIQSQNAMEAGLSDDQWRAFGSTLRAVHDSGLEAKFRERLRVEDFALPSAALVRQILDLVHNSDVAGAAAARFAAFLQDHAARIRDMLARAEDLGRSLQMRSPPFELILCHADIHAANIIAGDDGRIHLVDWDGPLIAPRERDLLFVVGSRIARPVEPREEDLFFAGYGPVTIDPTALAYYRYERIVEDIGEIGKSVFLDPGLGEEMRADEADLAMSFFAAGADIDHAENVTVRPRVGTLASFVN